jgi:murein DD-endopeptidase MepM/ murein hydrolase activator NlpD
VRIGRGETVWDLARRYNVSVAEIMAANQLNAQAVQQLTAGSSLVMPGVWQAAATMAPPERALSPMQERAMRLARRLGLGNRTAAQQLLHGRVQRRWISAAGGRGNQLPGTLRWPVTNGRLSRGYGSGQGGYHRALDIVADIGWNVRAAAPGIVGYSGRELTGFGNVVLVVHPGGWVTLYGHNSVNFVVAGQRVRAGAILAEVGSTGRSTGPHVHFELIYDGENCDPAALLRPGVRHRSRLARIERATWTEPRNPPASVRCAVRVRHPASDQPANE